MYIYIYIYICICIHINTYIYIYILTNSCGQTCCSVAVADSEVRCLVA